jgi:hypothetical protein
LEELRKTMKHFNGLVCRSIFEPISSGIRSINNITAVFDEISVKISQLCMEIKFIWKQCCTLGAKADNAMRS